MAVMTDMMVCDANAVGKKVGDATAVLIKWEARERCSPCPSDCHWEVKTRERAE